MFVLSICLPWGCEPGVWGCAAVMTPFFQAGHRSLAYQFTVNAPLLCPLFSIFRKFVHFQPCFGQNFSSLDPNFSKFSFPRPPFFKETPFPRPYILKPAWHTSTKKKKLSAPPPRGVSPHFCCTHLKRGCNWSKLESNRGIARLSTPSGQERNILSIFPIFLYSVSFLLSIYCPQFGPPTPTQEDLGYATGLQIYLFNNLRNSAIQSEEIIFILRMWQRRSLSEHNDSKLWRIDSKSWCHERQVRFLLKRDTSARTAPCTWAFINLGDDHHAWTDWNSLTGIDRQWVQK